MRTFDVNKRIRSATTTPVPDTEWLNLDDIGVELTSEDPDAPIEGALVPGRGTGWRASGGGPQTIVLEWPEPIRLHRIRLVFEEFVQPRTQEFVLRAFTADGGDRDIVRQQFTFSPPSTVREREEYVTNIEGVTRLELTVVPAIDGREAVAALREWRVA
jgi:hypothetical protein